jgi:chaperone required for assembly of F1-ATPase
MEQQSLAMRDIFQDIFEGEPVDPTTASQRNMRPTLRRRFYEQVGIAEGEAGHGLQLDGKPVRTPARRLLAAPTLGLAETLAAEWRAQCEVIDPANMPLTRLANSIIDGVAEAPGPVAAEVEKYLASDLLFYRAASPEGLVALQSATWDPVIAWARDAFGARFVCTTQMSFVPQPEAALSAARAAIPRDKGNLDPWRLGALHVITTLTGSALMALAVLHGRLSSEEAWAAAHVDEDWNMDFWGRDEQALKRRAYREAEMRSAVAVIDALRD